MALLPFVLFLLIAGALLCTGGGVLRARGALNKAFAARMGIFTWLVGFFFIVAVLMLPIRLSLLVLAPALLAATVIGRVWKRVRLQAAEELRPAVDLERMKRVN